MYKYFISYSVAYGYGFGFGHTETHTDFQIRGIDDIRRISRSIEKDFNYPQGSVVIINFKLFDE
ncbi:hypothetical protein Cdeb_01304 [Caldibacillus debilis GB1]|uniref:Uncharacterized protein n=1 Tax=Caldibacillus debilis GB1 TaxID=1339248 RepID=A0A420VDX8_9BACI|nr:hypothetical protein Cdeb_01304 [Caldibacillus debilis GB1]